jgi:hypothetical protein
MTREQASVPDLHRRHSPNEQKLDTAREWPTYGALGNYEETPLRLVPAFAFSSNADSKAPTGTQPEVAARPQLEREGWLLQQRIVDASAL